MKKFLSLLAGMVFVLAFGTAYADDMTPATKDTGDKMTRDDDLQKYYQDQGQGTVNQIPAVTDEKGSGAGGRGESDSTWKSDTTEKPAPVEKDTTNPSDSGRGMGDPSRSHDTYRY